MQETDISTIRSEQQAIAIRYMDFVLINLELRILSSQKIFRKTYIKI